MKKMNPKVKKKWIEALRSRKYKQCTERLCKIDESGNESYCCLGVLTDICPKNKWTDSIRAFGSLPEYVKKWAGLDGNDPGLTKKSNQHYDPSLDDEDNKYIEIYASELNDDYGKKFYEIARYIERNL